MKKYLAGRLGLITLVLAIGGCSGSRPVKFKGKFPIIYPPRKESEVRKEKRERELQGPPLYEDSFFGDKRGPGGVTLFEYRVK